MIRQLAHVCIRVRDIERTIDFYANKLGLPVTFRFERNGRTMGAYFSVGNSTFLEAFESDVSTGGSQIHFCLETDDIDAFIADMARKGVTCKPKSQGCDHSWQVWLTDPDGHAFELHQYTPESLQRCGGVAAVTW